MVARTTCQQTQRAINVLELALTGTIKREIFAHCEVLGLAHSRYSSLLSLREKHTTRAAPTKSTTTSLAAEGAAFPAVDHWAARQAALQGTVPSM